MKMKENSLDATRVGLKKKKKEQCQHRVPYMLLYSF
jgi:hypothetical protein